MNQNSIPTSPKWATWAWLGPPLGVALVFGAAASVLQPVRESLVDVGRLGVEVSTLQGGADYLLRDMAARLTWAAASQATRVGLIFGIVLTFFVIVTAARQLLSAPEAHRRRVRVIVVNGLIVVPIAAALSLVMTEDANVPRPLACWDEMGEGISENKSFSLMFDQLFRDMAIIEGCAKCGHGDITSSCLGDRYCELGSAKRIFDGIAVSNVMTFVFVGFMMLAVSLTLARSTLEPSVAELRSQQKTARLLLYTGAILLVGGVIEIYALFLWPSVHVGSGMRAQVAGLAQSWAVVLGVFFALLLGAIHAPAAWSIHQQSLRLAAGQPWLKSHDAQADWLEQQGLVGAWSQLGQAAAVFAPIVAGLLTGPIAELVGRVV